jgi:hypothetical protein
MAVAGAARGLAVSFVTRCNSCTRHIGSGDLWRCDECDFDLCAACHEAKQARLLAAATASRGGDRKRQKKKQKQVHEHPLRFITTRTARSLNVDLAAVVAGSLGPAVGAGRPAAGGTLSAGGDIALPPALLGAAERFAQHQRRLLLERSKSAASCQAATFDESDSATTSRIGSNSGRCRERTSNNSRVACGGEQGAADDDYANWAWVRSEEDLHCLGLDMLKEQLRRRGMKCSGTLNVRVRGLAGRRFLRSLTVAVAVPCVMPMMQEDRCPVCLPLLLLPMTWRS